MDSGRQFGGNDPPRPGRIDLGSCAGSLKQMAVLLFLSLYLRREHILGDVTDLLASDRLQH